MNQKALIVAIDDYGSSHFNLHGCLNDAREWKRVLTELAGVPCANIRELLDKDATKKNVLADLRWLFDAEPADRLYFVFSGHGSWGVHRTDDGNVVADECLLLTDNTQFWDDWLATKSRESAAERQIFVIDACYSGGMDKDGPGGQGSKSVPPSAPPPQGAARKHFGDSFAGAGKADEAGEQTIKGVLFAATSEDETSPPPSEETENLSPFTFAVIRVLKAQGNKLPLKAIHAGAANVLEETGFTQQPTLKGAPALMCEAVFAPPDQ